MIKQTNSKESLFFNLKDIMMYLLFKKEIADHMNKRDNEFTKLFGHTYKIQIEKNKEQGSYYSKKINTESFTYPEKKGLFKSSYSYPEKDNSEYKTDSYIVSQLNDYNLKDKLEELKENGLIDYSLISDRIKAYSVIVKNRDGLKDLLKLSLKGLVRIESDHEVNKIDDSNLESRINEYIIKIDEQDNILKYLFNTPEEYNRFFDKAEKINDQMYIVKPNSKGSYLLNLMKKYDNVDISKNNVYFKY